MLEQIPEAIGHALASVRPGIAATLGDAPGRASVRAVTAALGIARGLLVGTDARQ